MLDLAFVTDLAFNLILRLLDELMLSRISNQFDCDVGTRDTGPLAI